MQNQPKVMAGTPEVVSDEKLNQLLAASPAERVTLEYMKSRIASHEFIRVGDTVTLCHMTLDNGYSVRGESACVNPENYNEQIGQRVAYDKAISQLWGLFGFLLAEKNMLRKGDQQHHGH